MTDCDYCGKETTDGGPVHPGCSREWQRRFDSYECTVCGNGPVPEKGDWCGSCEDKISYKGYPGGTT